MSEAPADLACGPIPAHWHVFSVAVRSDRGRRLGSGRTYEARLRRDGGDREVRGVGSDPWAAVADAARSIA